MFHMPIDYDKAAKVSAKIEFPSGELVQYTATKVNEMYCIMQKDEVGVPNIAGYMHVTTKLDKIVGHKTQLVHINGDFDDKFLKLLDEDAVEELNLTVTQDKRAVGNTTKNRKLTWTKLDILSEDFSLEDYIYAPIPFEQVTTDKDLSWLENKDYRILRTKEETDEYLQLLYDLPKNTLIALDTETTGTRITSNHTDKIVGISISHKEGFGVYVPLRQKYGENNFYSPEEFIQKLAPVIDRLHHSETAKPLILMNAKFDWKVFKMYGIELNNSIDVYFMLSLIKFAEGQKLAYEDYLKHYMKFGYTEDVLHDVYYKKQIKRDEKKSRGIRAKTTIPFDKLPTIPVMRPASLKDAVSYYFNIDVLEMSGMFSKRPSSIFEEALRLANQGYALDELTKKKLEMGLGSDIMYDFRYAPTWFYEIYGPADADFPFMVHRIITQEGGDWEVYKGKLDTVLQIEMENIETIAEQEYYGARLIVEGIEKLGDEAKIKREEIRQEIYKVAGHEFNVSSGKQTGNVLFEEMGLPKSDKFKTKTGDWAVGKDTLNAFKDLKNEDGSPKYPIVSLLAKYSKVQKEISSFYESLPKLVVDGFLNPNFSVMGAETGRISCKLPNIQQMAPSCRTYVTPDNDHSYFAICDFSQVERRLMGGLSGDMAINERFIEDKEADSHIQTYANMMNVPYESVDGKQRKIGKILNFATGYGISPANLAVTLYGNDDSVHTMMAQDLIDKYFESVPIYSQFSDNMKALAKERGYSETFFGRRRCIVPFKLKNPSKADIASGDRAAVNMVVQGTAADILKLSMARLRAAFRKWGMYEDEARMVMNVHDEVTYSIADNIHPYAVCHIMKTAMEVDLSSVGFPPLYAGMNLGFCWKDGKADFLEAQVIHMEEMSEKGRKLLESGNFRNFDENPVEFWEREIIEFATRELYKEIKLGYIKDGVRYPYESTHDYHKNLRVTKYGGHANSLLGSPRYSGHSLPVEHVIFEALTHTEEEFNNNIQAMLNGQTGSKEKVVKLINAYNSEKIQNIIREGNTESLKDIRHYINLWLIDFAGDIVGKPAVSDILVESDRDGNITKAVLFHENGTQSVLNKVGELKDKKTGHEIKEKELTLEEKVGRDIEQVNKLIIWTLPENRADVFYALEKISQPGPAITRVFNRKIEDCYRVKVVLTGGNSIVVRGYMIEEVKPILLKIFQAYYTDLPYDFIDKDLDLVLKKLISDGIIAPE